MWSRLAIVVRNRAFFRVECRTPDSTGNYVSELTQYRIPGWYALENRLVCGEMVISPLTSVERRDSGIKSATFLSALLLASCVTHLKNFTSRPGSGGAGL